MSTSTSSITMTTQRLGRGDITHDITHNSTAITISGIQCRYTVDSNSGTLSTCTQGVDNGIVRGCDV